MTRSLDGVRPGNAICTHCGYQFGGLAIRDKVIVCPECGESVRFELIRPTRPAPALRAAGVGIGMLVLGALVFWGLLGVRGWRQGAAAGVTVWVSLVLVSLLLRARRQRAGS